MTLLSRRKLPITLPGLTPRVKTWVSLALIFWAAFAPAQTPLAILGGQGKPTFAPQLPQTPSLSVGMGKTIMPVRYQPGNPSGTGEASTEIISIQLEPPGIGRLSQLDSDEKLQERIRQQNSTEKHVFPDPPILSRDQYVGRGSLWQKRQMTVEPNFVCYGKLQSFFEEPNSERYGWDLGPLSIPVQLAHFGVDTALLPMRVMTDPWRMHECSTGHCLPGDPVPYAIYPNELTVTNSAAQLAVIAALIVIFP